MAESGALRDIEGIVTDYLLKYKKSTEDYSSYLQHSTDCLREFMTYDSREFRTEKVSVSSLGIIEMPTDMIGFREVGVAKNGEWWSFTERPDMVNTTTTTSGVEGHDDAF